MPGGCWDVAVCLLWLPRPLWPDRAWLPTGSRQMSLIMALGLPPLLLQACSAQCQLCHRPPAGALACWRAHKLAWGSQGSPGPGGHTMEPVHQSPRGPGVPSRPFQLRTDRKYINRTQGSYKSPRLTSHLMAKC